MQLEINSRHFALGDDMRDKIVEKLENLERYSPTEPVGGVQLSSPSDHPASATGRTSSAFWKGSDRRREPAGDAHDSG